MDRTSFTAKVNFLHLQAKSPPALSSCCRIHLSYTAIGHVTCPKPFRNPDPWHPLLHTLMQLYLTHTHVRMFRCLLPQTLELSN
jgi:hypothetical protein